MKKRLLLIAGLFLARLTVFANAEKLAVLRSGGSGDYWEDTPGNILPSNPCTGFEFRITFTFPSGYTGVKEFDWYANNTLVKTTTQVSYDAGNNPYGETPMLVTAENTKIVCKVIYKNASGGTSSPYASGEFLLLGKPLNLLINGPAVVDALARDASWSVATGSSNNFLYTPAPNTYTTTWQPPSGWTQTAISNNGNNVTFHLDDYTAGNLYATSSVTACGFSTSYYIGVSRSHPAPSFSDPSGGFTQVCQYSNSTPASRTFTINPVPGAVNYTYKLISYPLGTPFDGVGFDAAGGASTLTTTSTTVAVTFNNPNNLTLDVDATANYPDGGAGTGATRVTLTTMTWGSPFSWNPSCYTYEGSTGTGMNVTAPFIQGATYYWYLDGFLADVESTNTGTLWWTGESQVSVKAVSPCGESDLYSEYVPGCFAPSSAAAASNLNIYPNPSPGQVRIDLKQINKKASPTSQIKEIREIRIVDKMGAVKKVLQYPAGTQSASINIGNLPNDIYTLHISDGINRISKQLNKIN